LLARINLWTFVIPGLRERREDIEPNLQFELDQFATRTGRRVTFNKEARETFVDFAISATSLWNGNFRDLNGAVTRMATLAEGGRITTTIVEEEKRRLEAAWRPETVSEFDDLRRLLPPGVADGLDPFDRIQLSAVIDVCGKSSSLSAAGRQLFAVSRGRKATANDADRLRKYLQRFGLTWAQIGPR
jgi:transcriptional regulatory protein RtcR